jgi:hypothetical protein
MVVSVAAPVVAVGGAELLSKQLSSSVRWPVDTGLFTSAFAQKTLYFVAGNEKALAECNRPNLAF